MTTTSATSHLSRPTLRLLWLTGHYFPSRGGMAQSCDRIVNTLREKGLEVDVAHFSARARTWSVEEKSGGMLVRVPLQSDPAHAMNRLWHWLAGGAKKLPWSQIVAFGGPLPLQAGPIYSAWLDRPLVTLLRGNDFDAGIFSAKRRGLLRDAIVGSSAVGVVSREMLWKVARVFPGARPIWIPNGIDLSRWRPLGSDLEKAEAWRLENVKPGRQVLGFFGAMKPKKGVKFFLQTLLRSGLADRFHVLIVGECNPELLTWLEARRDELPVSLFPFIRRYELIPHYCASDWVVIGSLYDGLPNVVLEAGGLGRPVLASTAGGLADVLLDGHSALLFEPGDFHSCRRALEQAAALDDSRRLGLGSALRHSVEKSFTHDLEALRYRSMFLALQRRRALMPAPLRRPDAFHSD